MKLEHFRNIWNHPANQGRRCRAIGRVAMWQLRKRLTRKPLTLPIFCNLKLLCYPNQGGSSIMLYWGGWPDYDDMYFVARYLRPGDRVIDVGANIGIYSLLAAAHVGADGQVLALEPGITTYPVLLENIQLNRLAQIIPRSLALGPVDGFIRFLQNQDLTNRIVPSGAVRDVDLSGGLACDSHPSASASNKTPSNKTPCDDSPSEDSRSTDVPCARLDTLLDQPFALGKIDIEGSEPLAFAGGPISLAAGNPPVWLMEFKDRLLRKYGWTAARFKQEMERQGYRLGIYDADRNALSFPELKLDQLENVIAVKESALASVLDRLATSQQHVPGAPSRLRK